MTWFTQHRQEWIAETVRVFGYINREHLERKFGISTPQASVDLRQFQQEHPNALTYNTSTKRYEATPDRCPSCGRNFKDGETCHMGGCPMGGDF